MKRRFAWGLLGLLVVAGSALAQEAAQPGGDQGQQGQAQQRRRMRPDAGGMRGGMMGGRDLAQLLNLTPEQQAKVQEIYRSARQPGQAGQPGQVRQRPSQEDMQKMRDLRQQLREAAQAGDDAKVERLQAELQQMQATGPMAQFRQQQAKINEEIEKILDPQQQAKFKKWRELQEAGLPPYLISNPDVLKRSVLGIGTLTDVQKNQIEAVFERYEREANSPAATAESKRELGLTVAAEVVGVLKPSQKALLSAGGRMAGDRGERGGRQRRGGGQDRGNGGEGAAPAPAPAPAGQ